MWPPSHHHQLITTPTRTKSTASPRSQTPNLLCFLTSVPFSTSLSSPLTPHNTTSTVFCCFTCFRSARSTRIVPPSRRNMPGNSPHSRNAPQTGRQNASRPLSSATILLWPGARTPFAGGTHHRYPYHTYVILPSVLKKKILRSTLDNAYTQLISSLDNIAQDHSALSDQITSQVVDASKSLEKKYDDMKTKVHQLFYL